MSFRALLHNWRRRVKPKGIALPKLQLPIRRPLELAMAVVIKNEARYIVEWLEFHRLLGVQRFFIYDNGSTDNIVEILKPYIAGDIVVVIPWRHFVTGDQTQILAYAHAVCNFGHLSQWIGFFDIDEFVFPTEGDSLPAFLAERTMLPVVGVTGVNFGTDGHQDPCAGLVIESYTRAVPIETQRCFPQLLNIKTFVQPAAVDRALSAHYWGILNSSHVAFNEHGVGLMEFPRTKPHLLTTDLIRYNHYYTKSLTEWSAKSSSPNVKGAVDIFPRARYQYMFRTIEENSFPDGSMTRFVEPVKQRLARRELDPGCDQRAP